MAVSVKDDQTDSIPNPDSCDTFEKNKLKPRPHKYLGSYKVRQLFDLAVLGHIPK